MMMQMIIYFNKKSISNLQITMPYTEMELF